MDIHTEYEIGAKVLIKPFDNIQGYIMGFYYSTDGLKYYVSYWKDFNRETDYFYSEEIEALVQ